MSKNDKSKKPIPVVGITPKPKIPVPPLPSDKYECGEKPENIQKR